MQLVIAEKPSVARDLARVLGVRRDGPPRWEGPRHVITWCIGHLVELDEPAAYDGRWKAWRLDTLPMIPDGVQAASGAGHAGSAARGARSAARPALFGGGERMRCGARRRAHLPLRLRAGGQPAPGAAAVDLVADRRGDPRRVRATAPGRAVRRAGGRGALSLGGRLAGRHERDPRGHDLLPPRGRARARRSRLSIPSAACRRRRWPSS